MSDGHRKCNEQNIRFKTVFEGCGEARAALDFQPLVAQR